MKKMISRLAISLIGSLLVFGNVALASTPPFSLDFLTVYPEVDGVSMYYEVLPGTLIEDEVRITNLDPVQDAIIDIDLDEDAINVNDDFLDWFDGPTGVLVPANSFVDIPFSFEVPEDADPETFDGNFYAILSSYINHQGNGISVLVAQGRDLRLVVLEEEEDPEEEDPEEEDPEEEDPEEEAPEEEDPEEEDDAPYSGAQLVNFSNYKLIYRNGTKIDPALFYDRSHFQLKKPLWDDDDEEDEDTEEEAQEEEEADSKSKKSDDDDDGKKKSRYFVPFKIN